MNIWKQVDANKQRSIFLVFIFVLVVIGIGWLFSNYYGNPAILYFAVALALTQSLVGYYGGDSIILSSSGAQLVTKRSDLPVLWNAVENMSIASGLPMPKVYVINDPAPNAFATGRDPKHASIAATTGLLQVLDKNELEGVVAHEMSHVGNYDIRLMTIITVLVSVIAILSDIFVRSQIFGFGRKRDNNSEGGGLMAILSIVALVLAPIVGTIIQLAISRKREFLADADGALLTGYPAGLAGALEKISKFSKPLERANTATAHLYISNPLGGGNPEEKEPGFLAKTFSTHPPIKERIRLLRQMS
ncbi:MAG: M48 family metallopeptidase [Patescibacteria group bacterium]|jgi:heat shock protein HtpX